MKDYKNQEPVFSESIKITEPTDPAHADIINEAPIQIFQNTIYNRNVIEDVKKRAGDIPEYNTEETCKAGIYRLHNGVLYKCLEDTSGEWDPECWAQTDAMEEIRETKGRLDAVENPTFDDSGEVEGISSFPDFLGSVVNKMSLFQFFRNLKAGMGYVLHMGKLVNNGLCDTPGQFALDAAYGKNLQDQLTKLNSDLRYKNIENIFTYDETKLAIHAYVENNCVCITIVMKTTCPPNTEIKFTITDKKYLPRHLIFGAYGSGMSGLDHDKFNSAMIHDDGNCIIYLNDTLSWQEFVSFCYPCRIDQ